MRAVKDGEKVVDIQDRQMIKAVAVLPGKPNTIHLREVPKPAVSERSDTRRKTLLAGRSLCEHFGPAVTRMTAAWRARMESGSITPCDGPARRWSTRGRYRSQ